jgi:predicted nucleic acid-binding protein
VNLPGLRTVIPRRTGRPGRKHPARSAERSVPNEPAICPQENDQELFVTATRKIPKPLDVPPAAQIIDDLAHWQMHAPAPADVLAAIGIHQRTGASLRDAAILRSARELGCQTLHSEDLNAGQQYEGVQVRHPFLA